MNNRGLLTVIAVILLGIFTIALVQYTEEQSNNSVGDQIGEAFKDIGDEIDDNTDAR